MMKFMTSLFIHSYRISTPEYSTFVLELYRYYLLFIPSFHSVHTTAVMPPPHQLSALNAQALGLPETRDEDPFTHVLNSFIRMTMAGFGGAVAGLAMAKSHRQNKMVLGAAVVRRGKPYHSSTESLPTTWAVACMTFAGIVETTQLANPTRIIVPDNKRYSKYVSKALDMALGGALAGAIFRGATKSIAPPRIMAGVGPGLALGALAGVAQATAEYVTDELERIEEEKERLKIETMRQQLREAQQKQRELLEAEIAALDAKEKAEADQLANEQEEATRIESAKTRPWWKIW